MGQLIRRGREGGLLVREREGEGAWERGERGRKGRKGKGIPQKSRRVE